MPSYSQTITEMLSEILTMQKCYFLKPIIHSQIISFSVISGENSAAFVVLGCKHEMYISCFTLPKEGVKKEW